MDNELHKYKMICTLKFGDIYGQIIMVLSLPFLLFAFVTTLLNRIEFVPMEEELFSRTVTRGSISQDSSPESAVSTS